MDNLNAPDQFFISDNPMVAEDILMNWPLTIIMKMIEYGRRLSIDAENLVDELNSNGEYTELNKVQSDIKLISNNVKKLTKAYSLAMN
jgi:hypothetical protein